MAACSTTTALAQPVRLVRRLSRRSEKSAAPSISDFDLCGYLGAGGYGMVLVASHRRVGRQYAIKVIDKRIVCAQPSQVASVYREREVLASIRHPYIVPMRHAFQTADHLCLVLDYVGGGNMYADLQRNGAYSHERAQFYGAQVVLALEHLHSRGILYRDLKPDNVLLTTHGSIQLADMGAACGATPDGSILGVTDGAKWTGKVKPNGRRMTITGTHGYRAPEMYDREYSKPADWWCVGILIVEMLTGENPLRGANRKESEHLAKTLDVQLPDTVLPPARETALAFLVRDWRRRLGTPTYLETYWAPAEADKRAVGRVKASPFFAPIDFDRMLAGSLKPTFAVRCAQLPHHGPKGSTPGARTLDDFCQMVDYLKASVEARAKQPLAAEHEAAFAAWNWNASEDSVDESGEGSPRLERRGSGLRLRAWGSAPVGAA